MASTLRASFAARFPRVRRGERIEHFDTARQRKDGTLIDISLTISPVRDSSGRIVGASKVAREITDRKRSERSTALLAAIVDSSDDAIVSKTLDGIITSWNKSAERIFGYLPEEAVGQHITLIIPRDRWGEESSIIARLRRGERVDHFLTLSATKARNSSAPLQPRSGERMQPTAQAVGKLHDSSQAPKGRKRRPASTGERSGSPHHEPKQ
jgi:PAS domain S-box-containing protein